VQIAALCRNRSNGIVAMFLVEVVISLSPGYASSIFRARTSGSSSSSSDSSSCVGSAAPADVGCGSLGGPAASEDGGTGGAGKGGVGCGNVQLERRAGVSTSNGLDQDGN